MAFRNTPRSLNIGSKSVVYTNNERLEKLEKKLNLVAAAEGKTKSEVIADALDAYLPKKWETIIKAYNEDKNG